MTEEVCPSSPGMQAGVLPPSHHMAASSSLSSGASLTLDGTAAATSYTGDYSQFIRKSELFKKNELRDKS